MTGTGTRLFHLPPFSERNPLLLFLPRKKSCNFSTSVDKDQVNGIFEFALILALFVNILPILWNIEE